MGISSLLEEDPYAYGISPLCEKASPSRGETFSRRGFKNTLKLDKKRVQFLGCTLLQSKSDYSTTSAVSSG
jgi:hypothetical protein